MLWCARVVCRYCILCGEVDNSASVNPITMFHQFCALLVQLEPLSIQNILLHCIGLLTGRKMWPLVHTK